MIRGNRCKARRREVRRGKKDKEKEGSRDERKEEEDD